MLACVNSAVSCNILLCVIARYLDGCSREHCKADISQHGSFYALCQAAFYTFVFRHRQLLDSREGGV